MNPFIIDSPAPADELIDRASELRQLADLSEAGHNTRLVAPRRYGKTTLLAGLGEEAQRRGMRHVYVDFFGVLTLDDIAGRIDRAYSGALRGALASWYAALRRGWQLRGRAGLAGTGVEAQSVGRQRPEELLAELLDLPRRLHERDGLRTLVMMDEFQEILSASDSADGVIRSTIQHHRHEASYVFAGSHPGLLNGLFSDRDRPLYGQSREIRLAPLADGDLAEYIESRFEAADRTAGPVMGSLLDIVRGHPQRAMLLAHHLWERTSSAADPTQAWADALEAALLELQEAFERYWQQLSANERRVLAAVAWTGKWGQGGSLLSNDTLTRFEVSKSSARTVSERLVREGDLVRTSDGRPHLVDPLLEVWIGSDRRPR